MGPNDAELMLRYKKYRDHVRPPLEKQPCLGRDTPARYGRQARPAARKGAAHSGEPHRGPVWPRHRREPRQGREDTQCPKEVSEGKEAFAELVRRHQKSLINFFYRLIWDRNLAEDFAQEVFIRLVRSARNYTRRAKFTTFLYKIARNFWIDYLKTRQYKPIGISLDNPIDPDTRAGTTLKNVLAGESKLPEEIVINKEMVTRIKQALDRINPDQRIVLNLCIFEGLNYSEAAEILDIPVGTAKSRLHTALMKLKKIIT